MVENYVADGPYQPDEWSADRADRPAVGLPPAHDATYYPVPWLLSSAGYGVLVDSPETSYFRLDKAGSWSVEVVGPPDESAGLGAAAAALRLRFFAGPEPADVLERFTRRTGRQPPAAAPWVFGPWVQPTGERSEQLAMLDQLQAAMRRSRSPRPICTTCRAATSRAAETRSGPDRRDPRTRPRGHDLFQPDGLHRLRARSSTRRRPAAG